MAKVCKIDVVIVVKLNCKDIFVHRWCLLVSTRYLA